MRTLEFQRPMLRATNTGATAIIDHRGQVQAMLPPFTQGVLDGSVQGRDGLTPFAWWSARFGLWPWLLLAAGGACAELQRPARTSVPGRAALSWPSRCTHWPATQVPR